MAELGWNEVAVSKSEYDDLLRAKSKVEWLEEKVNSVTEELSNKTKALDEAKKNATKAKDDLKAELEVEKEKFKTVTEKFELSEWENLNDKLDSLIDNNSKYSEVLEKEKTDRTERIDGFKKTLWEEFMKEKSAFFEWMEDIKQEALLQEFINIKGLWDKTNSPKVDINNKGKAPDNTNLSDFDKQVASGASADDLFNAL